MSTRQERLDAKIEERAASVVFWLKRGGCSLSECLTMTDASEAVGGSSGRGNDTIIRMIAAAGSLGFLRIETRGRVRRVYLSQKGLDALARHPEIESMLDVPQEAGT